MKDNIDIDIVIMWVDGADKGWIKEKNKYLGMELGEADVDASSKRYRDWGNLQYIFRGIEEYMPWVRKIHLVTNGQKPTWLNLSNDKLNWVKHEDYMPKEYLPTFSANPIELNLHRIKDLAEQFIFFNDDMFVVSPMQKTDFFRKGLPCDQATLWRITNPDYDDPFWHIPFNDIGVINKHFSKWAVLRSNWHKLFSPRNGIMSPVLSTLFLPYNHLPGFLINHIPQAYLKSTFSEVWDKNPNVLHSVSLNRFRSNSDVNQYLIRWWQLCTGNFAPSNLLKITRNFSVFPEQLEELEHSLKKRKYKLICINDAVVYDFETTKHSVNNMLHDLLPNKSGYEL